MEDQGQDPNSVSHTSERSSEGVTVSVRSRWTPKPEQILILESIFNSGMVNPPKDETVRIRKLLEKFGAVGDANVFYWFQNRRSRSRRRQRQMQQAASAALHPHQLGGATPSPYDQTQSSSSAASAAMVGYHGGCSSSYLAAQEPPDALYSFSADHMGFTDADHAPDLNFHTGYITVFINGVATEVPRGLLDIKTMFGQDLMLVHSSGIPIPTNEFGFLIQDLQHGESYFLVSKPT